MEVAIGEAAQDELPPQTVARVVELASPRAGVVGGGELVLLPTRSPARRFATGAGSICAEETGDGLLLSPIVLHSRVCACTGDEARCEREASRRRSCERQDTF